MTRETKIGLLVGMAFIIIVGILLGDSVRHAADLPPAQLPGVGPNVRSAVSTPGGNTAPPPISVQANSGGGPQQTVPMQREVAGRQGSMGIVIGPGGAGSGAGHLQPQTLVGPRTGDPAGGGGTRVEPQNPLENTELTGGIASDDPRIRAGIGAGIEIVPVGQHSGPSNTHPIGSGGAMADARKARQYQAGPGDNLSKIATFVYGSNSKAFRDAIVNANPTLKADPNKVIAGVTYVIPAVDLAAGSTAPPAPQQPAPQPAAPQHPQPPIVRGTPPAAAPEYFYTVQPTDTLWKIAKEQLGDASGVAAIQELNKDLLKGSTNVRPNMKLRLPSKPVAINN